MSITKDAVIERLNRLTGPDGGPLGRSKALSEIVITGGKVYFSIAVDASRAKELEVLRQAAQTAVAGLPGVAGAVVSLTAEAQKSAATAAAPAAPARGPQGGKPLVPGVKHIIAVASGKGGVGKSTTSANLALGLKALGLKVGILDADIYGPSMPKLFALSGRPSIKEGRILIPMEAYGLKVMSIGFLVDEDQAMIWRGPMVMSAITQMLREVDWGELDVLVVDMPPGTGDAQLTMAQNVPLAGSVIVSTPQDMALIDARRGVAMFNKVSIPILGIVENMSYFVAPDTGTRYDIFGHGGAKAEATRLNVPFLGEVPLDMEIRERSDTGIPITVGNPDGIHAETYRSIARAVWAQLASGAVGKPAPRIIYE